ncbi:Cystinosin-like protein [Fragariocoptes setiger]|uniref:Cystinosin-like protein n=1 Tax=Fragariocoptes setiger TaxID=1670756 RepID=A0ABQ7S9R4_9ACAR|nr:Cystinosin-like protein [Fragariocoptes setiger]
MMKFNSSDLVHLLASVVFVLCLSIGLAGSSSPVDVTVSTNQHEICSEPGQNGSIQFKVSPSLGYQIQATLIVLPSTSSLISFPELDEIKDEKNQWRVFINASHGNTQLVNPSYEISGSSFGKVIVNLMLEDDIRYRVIRSNAFIHFNAPQNHVLQRTSDITTWISALLQSSCVLPQIWRNFQLRSTNGLAFDYIELTWTASLTGFLKTVMLSSDEIKFETLNRYNYWWPEIGIKDWLCTSIDILTSVILIFQSMAYKTGNTRLFNLSSVTTHFDAIFVITSLFALYAVLNKFADWSLYLHLTIIINIASRLLRNIMQIYFNFCRKSTANFSVLLPIIELSGSLLQPFVLMFTFINFGTYNITTNLALAWGLMVLDKVMMLQHYYWFKRSTSIEGLEPAHEPYEEGPHEIETQQHSNEPEAVTSS